jgi:hypothetical protein
MDKAIYLPSHSRPILQREGAGNTIKGNNKWGVQVYTRPYNFTAD